MISESLIQQAIARLLEAAPPGSRVILFGSHARGDADERSDVDLMVIEPEVDSRIEEMIRLNEVLRPLRIAVDLLVASEEHFQYWCDTPNTVYYEAAREGKSHESVA